MGPEKKHVILLICSGISAITSFSLPWVDGASLLHILAVNEVTKVFPEISLSLAISDSQLAAVYVAFYLGIVSSSFIIFIGLMQLRSYHDEYRWFRLLAISLYAGAALSVIHFPAYPAQFGQDSFGFYLFTSPLVLFVLAEYHYEKSSSLRRLAATLGKRRPLDQFQNER